MKVVFMDLENSTHEAYCHLCPQNPILSGASVVVKGLPPPPHQGLNSLAQSQGRHDG